MASITTPNAALRDAIFRSGKPQIEIARKAKIHETRLSKIVRGWVTPNPDERDGIVRALRWAGLRDIDETGLFATDELVRKGA